MGVIGTSTARAYPFDSLGERAVINDVLDGRPILVLYDRAAKGAAVYKRPLLSNGKPIVFEETHPHASFPLSVSAANTEGTWNYAGRAVAGSGAETDLKPVATAYKGFWFAWSAYYENIEIHESR